MLDRTLSPKYIDIPTIKIPQPYLNMTRSGSIPIFSYTGDDQKVIKLDMIFKSGKWYEPENGLAYFTGNMLKGGTSKSDSNKIASDMDYYGAVFSINSHRDFSHLQLLTIKKHFYKTLSIMKEIIVDSIFPEDYLDILKNIEKNRISLDDKKNNIVSYKILREQIYGKNHPYGIRLEQSDIDKIKIKDLKSYYSESFFSDCEVYISGIDDESEIDKVLDYLDYLKPNNAKDISHPIPKARSSKINLEIKDSVQSSISIGKSFPTKNHEDFIPLYIVNELLGGFFGSRLMTNIREEKGYTYGIYSQIIPMFNSSMFCISTDVAKEYAKKTCDEVYKEIEKLQTNPVDDEELDGLKKHIKGKILLSIDGPYSMMDKFIKVRSHGLNIDYYKKLYDKVSNIDQEEIMNITKKYLDLKTLNKVIVGS